MSETMSNLEYTLRHTNGINIILRNKMIRAYLSETGAAELPALIVENEHLIDPALFNRLLRLSKDENAN